jgi:hypothetical protein
MQTTHSESKQNQDLCVDVKYTYMQIVIWLYFAMKNFRGLNGPSHEIETG